MFWFSFFWFFMKRQTFIWPIFGEKSEFLTFSEKSDLTAITVVGWLIMDPWLLSIWVWLKVNHYIQKHSKLSSDKFRLDYNLPYCIWPGEHVTNESNKVHFLHFFRPRSVKISVTFGTLKLRHFTQISMNNRDSLEMLSKLLHQIICFSGIFADKGL